MSGAKARGVGLVVLLVGAAFAWFFGLQPLLEARAGAAAVRIEPKAFLAAAMAMLCGLAMLLGGPKVAEVMTRPPRSRRDHLIVWPLFASSMAAGGFAWWWIEGQVAVMGYVGSPVI